LLHGQENTSHSDEYQEYSLMCGQMDMTCARYIHRSQQHVSIAYLLTTAENSSMYQISCSQSDSHSVVR